MKLGQESIFPLISEDRTSMYSDLPNTLISSSGGISTRLYLAGLAMQGFLGKSIPPDSASRGGMGFYEYVAAISLAMADELLKQEEETR